MLTLKLITEETDRVVRGLEKKHFHGAQEAIQQVLAVDKQRRESQQQLDKNLSDAKKMAAQIGSPQTVMAMAAMMPPMATMPPTDISAPPPIMTMVAPITAVPKMDTCRRMLTKFLTLKKCSAKMAKNANTSTSIA